MKCLPFNEIIVILNFTAPSLFVLWWVMFSTDEMRTADRPGQNLDSSVLL